MLFRVFLSSLLLLGPGRSMAQIDSLKTVTDVLQFVRRVAPEYEPISFKLGFKRIAAASFDSLAAIYHLQSFETADLDGNGFTDLIFNGSIYYSPPPDSVVVPFSLAILSFGKDSFIVRRFSLDYFADIAAHLLQIDGKSYVQTVCLTSNRPWGPYLQEYRIDTLAWAFNTFIEKKPPVKRKITRIDYNAANGMGFQHNISLRICGDSVRLTKERLEDFQGMDAGGVFLTRLDSGTRQRLYGLLEAIDFAALNDSFESNGSDQMTGNLQITYDEGQKKVISDYGCRGTYGLEQVQLLLFDLIETQHWTSADPVTSRSIDSLHTDAEVLGLVRTLGMDYPFLDFEPDTENITGHVLSDYRERSAAFGLPRWQKGDIGGNGRSDLLFNGYLNEDRWSRQVNIVVRSFGQDSLQYEDISGANVFFAAKMIPFQGREAIKINYLDAIVDSTQAKGYHLTAREDTLMAVDGRIVEVPSLTPHHIERITIADVTGHDVVIVTRRAIYWYRNDALPPEGFGDNVVVHHDSINLFAIRNREACQQLLSLAGGINFERLNPELLCPNQEVRAISSDWDVQYDHGKHSRFTFAGTIGSYRLTAVQDLLREIEQRSGWKLISKNVVTGPK
jgi:hypothetical protein